MSDKKAENTTPSEVIPKTDDKKNKESQKSKKYGFFKTMFIFLFALSVMVGVASGTVYYILKNNINNVAENNRQYLSKIPIVKYALPLPKDPDDAQNYSDEDLRPKYAEVLKNRNELKDKVLELTKDFEALDKNKGDSSKIRDEARALRKEADAMKTQVVKERAKLEDDKKKFNEAVATKDKLGFKQYYEQIDKETAKKIYEETVKATLADEGTKQIAKTYETMDPTAASKVLQELGITNPDLVVKLLKNIKKETTAEILAACDPKFASEISQKMDDSYKQ